MKSYISIEQSKKLAEILLIDTAGGYNLCKNCAANIEQKCCIRGHNIKKGRSRCNDYDNIDTVFYVGYEPLPEYIV